MQKRPLSSDSIAYGDTGQDDSDIIFTIGTNYESEPDELLRAADEGITEALFRLIDAHGTTDPGQEKRTKRGDFMNKHLVVDLQGRKLGELASGKVTNERGETVFRLCGNSLSEMRSGKAYTVTSDGRVIDQYRGQFGFIYNYPLYSSNQVSYSSNSTEIDRRTAAETSSTRKAASGKSGKWLVILLIVLAAVYMVYHSSTDIVGTWVIKSVSIDGRMYSYDEAQKLFNQYYDIEYHFNKDGTVAVKADGRAGEGRWYERWENNYEAYFWGVSYDISIKNGEMTISDDQHLVICRKKLF